MVCLQANHFTNTRESWHSVLSRRSTLFIRSIACCERDPPTAARPLYPGLPYSTGNLGGIASPGAVPSFALDIILVMCWHRCGSQGENEGHRRPLFRGSRTTYIRAMGSKMDSRSSIRHQRTSYQRLAYRLPTLLCINPQPRIVNHIKNLERCVKHSILRLLGLPAANTDALLATTLRPSIRTPLQALQSAKPPSLPPLSTIQAQATPPRDLRNNGVLRLALGMRSELTCPEHSFQRSRS